MLPRFALRIKPSGSAAYFVRYQTKRGAIERRIKIGDARAMSVDDARKAAKKLLGQIDNGADPVLERKTDAAEWKFVDLWKSYSGSPAFLGHAPKSQSTDTSRWRVHIDPRIGRTLISAFNVPAAKRLYAEIASVQPGTRLGGSGTARKALRLVSAMPTYAVDQGRLAANPLIGQLRLPGDGRRSEILTQDDYARLFQSMAQMVSVGELRQVVADCILFIAATGCRRGEALKLRWDHIDNERRIATLPPEQHKTGKKTGTTRTIGLVPIVLEMLARRSQEATNEVVFPPVDGAALSINRDWVRIRDRLGLPKEVVIHSLRHSIASHGAMAGLSPHELMASLGHRQISTVTRYVQWLEEQARALDKAAAAALGSLAFGTQAKDDKEVPLK